jgi:hypothetical protein
MLDARRRSTTSRLSGRPTFTIRAQRASCALIAGPFCLTSSGIGDYPRTSAYFIYNI